MDSLVGNSPWLRSLQRSIEQLADRASTILIVGPSGTGKELIARAIHRRGYRAEGPLVAVDCASVPATLFASQLFGHVKGAFSGADCETLGSFRAADGGTIFLDEISELGFDLQAQLLRVIQERAVTPVGDHCGIPVDVRIIAASNRDLDQEVDRRTFSSRPLLSAPRGRAADDPLARVAGGHRTAVPSFSGPLVDRERAAAADVRGRRSLIDGRRLAGQRAAVAERSGTRRVVL